MSVQRAAKRQGTKRLLAKRPNPTRHRRAFFESLEPRQLLAALTPGNALVVRLGDGTTPMDENRATAIFLDEVAPDGTLVQTLALPTSDSGSNQTLTGSPTSTAEGLISLSDDGQYAFLAGYDAAPSTPGLTGTASSSVARVVARIDSQGNIDTTTRITDGFSAGTVRSVYSSNGADIWVSGGTGSNTNGGIRYTTFGSTGTSTQLNAGLTNTRGIAAGGGQLFVANITTALSIGKVGTGLPTTTGQVITSLPGIPPTTAPTFGNNPTQIFFADLSPSVPGVDTLYVADTSAGLCKFSLVGTNWVPNGAIQRLGGGISALSGQVSGTTVNIFAITTVTGDDELMSFADSSGYTGALSGEFLTTNYDVTDNFMLRGVTFVPQAVASATDPDPSLATGSGNDEIVLRRVGDNVVITVGGTTVLDQPLVDTQSLTIDGQAGNDRLTVDYSGGDPLPAGGLTYHGGAQAGIPGDRLSIVGTGTQTATYLPNGTVNSALDNDGVVTVDGKAINFTGLEPMDLIGMAVANVVFPNGNDVVNLANGLTTGGAAAIVVSGTSGGVPFESVALRNNTQVNIDTTTFAGIDTVTLTSADNLHGNASLSLTTGGEAGDMLDIDGPATFTGSVSLASQRIDFNLAASVISAGVQVTLNSGAGPITDGSLGTPSVVTPTLLATAGNGLTLGTSVANLTAAVTGVGNLSITEASAVALTSVTTASGTIAITAGGAVTAEHVNSGTHAASFTITGGGLASALTDPGVADMVAGTLTITLNTAGNNVGSAANRLEINATQLQILTNTAAQNNAFILDTAGGLAMFESTVGGIAGSTFDILVQSGSLTTVNGGQRDVGADVIVLAVTGVASTIGNSSANQLEINAVSSLTATSAGGGIFIDDLALDLPVALVNAGGGTVDLRSALGDIVSVTTDPGVPDIVGSTINLRLGTAGNTLGTVANRLEIDGTSLQIFSTGAGNNYFLVDTAGGLQVNNSTTGGGGSSIFDLVVQNGNLTGAGTAIGDVRADGVVIAVTGVGSTIGASVASPLIINANNSASATTAGGNIFVRDGQNALPLGIVNANGGNVDLHAPGGAITDASDAASNVTAASLSMRASGGIGSTNAIETEVGALAAQNGSGGSIQVANTVGGLLTIGTVNGLSGVVNSSASPAQVVITNASPLTVAANVTSLGNVLMAAGETAADDVDNLLVTGAGVLVQSTSGSVTLNAGDNLTLALGTTVQAGTSVNLNVDEGDLDPTGETLSVFGSVISTTGANLTGGNDNDTFHVLAQTSSSFQVSGEDPFAVPVGDTLNLDITGATGPTLSIGGVGAGSWSFANRQSVTYTSIEEVNTTPLGVPYNLVLDMQLAGFQNGGADEIFVRMDAGGTDLLIDVNGTPVFQGLAATINSLTVIGSADDERLRIDETAGGLPQFLGQTPAVNNTLIGGGIADPSHLGPAADQILETLFAAGTPWDATDVTIHFDGRSGLDSIDLNLTTFHTTAYTSDTLDSANSGNLGTAGLTGPDFLMSFANLAPINLSGAGGLLLIDATGTPTANLDIADDGGAGDGWSQVSGDGGFETTRFRGYSAAAVIGGNGTQTIDLLGLDSATSLNALQIQAGNTTDFFGGIGDAADDFIRIHSTPAQTPVGVDADAGNDRLELFDAAFTVDNIAAQVTIDGGTGNNALVVIDRGDIGPDTILIDENSIEGITGFTTGSPDIAYSNIDTLDLTATQGSDTLDASFAPGSDLDTVTLSGWTGGDQFYLSTTDEQIGGTATGIQTINLFGDAPGNPNPGDGNDIFGETPASLIPGTLVGLSVRMIRNSISTLINIDGGRPTAAPNPPIGDQVGDILNLDTSALLPTVIVATLGGTPSQPGVAQSIAAPPSHRPVNFIEIEDINLVDRGILTQVQMGDLFIRGSNAVDNVSFAGLADPNVARVRVNAYQNNFTITRRAVVYALGGNDYVQMGNFNRVAEFYGGDGDDYLTGYNQADKLVGGIGRDRINAGQGNNVVWGDQDPVEIGLPDTEANRQLMASIGPELAEALYADTLSTLDGSDSVYGGPGSDQITTVGGIDWVYGGQGNDTISGGAGNDRLYGGEGNDNLNGGADHDLLSGGGGNDVLNAVAGNDVLIGGAGNDSLFGDVGRDVLFDGSLTTGGGTSDSQTIGDAADLAMQALLADWLADFAINNPFTDDHAGADTLRGGLNEADAFSSGAASEILDFEVGRDSLLP